MKKIISIIAAMVLTISMTAVSVYAAEADTDEASTQATCTHSNGTYMNPQKTYVRVSDVSHNIYVSYVYYCNSCNALMKIDGAYYMGTEDHDFGPEKYMGSNHSGNYTEHYYTYRKVCKLCAGAVERIGSTGCTAKRCIEPQ